MDKYGCEAEEESMNQAGLIVSHDLSSLLGRRHALRPSTWFGALSFEERGMASLFSLADSGLMPRQLYILDYPTNVSPYLEAENRRERNFESILRAADRIGGTINRKAIDPYGFQALQDIFGSAASCDAGVTIVDITCMTKIHVIALAAAISRWREGRDWIITYSSPESYGYFVDSVISPGWRDVIVAPLAETALLFNEARSRAIIIPGHEADRLLVALAEIEPSGGHIIITSTPKRPDLQYLCERRNRKVMYQLTRMRFSDWSRKVIKITDMDTVGIVVGREVEIARSHSAPVILFPFGPKPFAFSTAFRLCSEYPEAAWFAYPIPMSDDTNYSEGIKDTIWISPMWTSA